MMRGSNSWGVAVRKPSGGIERVSYPLDPPGSRHRALRLPVIRGIAALYESLRLGLKALDISANVGLESSEPSASKEDKADGKKPAAFGFKEMAITVTIAMAMALGFFMVVPLVIVKQFEEVLANPFLFTFTEAMIQISLFLLYIVGISLIPDLKRVFQYHGAEHKVIHAYEACGRSDASEAERHSTLHPRCGTAFLLLVVVLAVVVFAAVGRPSLHWLVLSRIIGIPLIVGLAYEIGIKWAGRHPDGIFARILLWPGIQLQRLTTREPTPDQLEVAAAALEEVMARDALLKMKKVEEAAPAPA